MAAISYTQEELTKAILLIIDQGMSPKEASKVTGISKRTLQRYKSRYVDDQTPEFTVKKTEVAIRSDNTVQSAEAKAQLDDTFVARAKFIKDVVTAKQTVLERINKIAKKSQNLDALQRTIKTLSELDGAVKPDGEGKNNEPLIGTVNVFQQINQKLINQGYEGPSIEDTDIITGD